uniref:Caspase family p20 domain-containing protein n=1 Tax=Arion vulgaris TaxID=1028688 RepID=A0A0B7A953_9EUPU
MDQEKLRELEQEIEELNRVEDEGEDQDTVDGLRKFFKKQLAKICRKDAKKLSGASLREPASATSEKTDKGQGDPDSDNIYDFTNQERGLAVIIDNEDFSLTRRTNHKHDDRPGSACDSAALFQTFKNLGFNVWVKKNLTVLKMIEVLRLARDEYDHSAADCFVCAILTHGSETLVERESEKSGVRRDLLFGVDGKAIATSSVVQVFSDESCPRLIGKPRLFFVQACRGTKCDDGVQIVVTKQMETIDISMRKGHDRTDQGQCLGQRDTPAADNQTSKTISINSPEVEPAQTRTADAKSQYSETRKDAGDIDLSTSNNASGLATDMTDGKGVSIRNLPLCPAPLYKDSLIMYATPPGYYAWRRKDGAWFVQSLCAVLDNLEISQKSLLNALVQVVRVATKYESDIETKPHMHKKKEVPVIESMLVKDIYFY